MRRYLKNVMQCLWVSSALSMLVFTNGLVIYFVNTDQFNIGPVFALCSFFFIVALSSIVMAALFGIAHAYAPVTVQACALACCCDVFLQYNFWSSFFASYKPEHIYEWDFIVLALILCLLLLVPFALAWMVRGWLRRNVVKISIVILLTQLAVIAKVIINYEAPVYDFTEYTVSDKDKFTFGSEENIIILVVDCMGEGICKEVLEKYPELHESLKDFTCFDRMISPLPWTMYAIPAMMTGVNFPQKGYRQPDNETDHSEYLAKVCSGDSSLFMALKTKGFRVEAYPFLLPTISYSPDVIDNSIPVALASKKQSILKIGEMLCLDICPFFMISILQLGDSLLFLTFENKLAGRRLQFDRVFLNRLQSECRVGKSPKVFKYLHLQGAHENINSDEKLEHVRVGLKYKQLRGSLRNFELLVRRLKELGLYDNSTILLVGDHTECYDVQNIAFVKRRNEHREALAFNSVPCQISDIAGFLLKEYGISTDLPSLYDKQPVVGDGSVRSEQTRYADFNNWKLNETFSDDEERDLSTCRMLIDDGALIFENFIDEKQIAIGSKVVLILSQIEGNDIWTATLDYSQRFACLRTNCDGVPDGAYQLELHFMGFDENGTVKPKYVNYLPTINISNGNVEFIVHKGN